MDEDIGADFNSGDESLQNTNHDGDEYRLANPKKMTRSKFQSQRPLPRSGHKLACDEDNVYIFGGYVSNPGNGGSNLATFSIVMSDLWRYSFITAEWTKLKCVNLPKQSCMSSLSLLNKNTLVIFGGTNLPLKTSCKNNFMIGTVQPAPNQNVCVFRRIDTTGDLPPPVFGHCVCTHEGYFYTFGGTNGNAYTKNVYRLSLAKKKWEIVFQPDENDEELPHVRFAHQIALYNYRVYMLGGSQNSVVFTFNNVMCFDLEDKQWSKVPTYGDKRTDLTSSYPTPRSFFTAVQDSRNAAIIYIAGGMTVEGVALRDCWKLDLDSMKWFRTEMFDLWRSTYMHCSGMTVSGKIIHFGGIEVVQSKLRPFRSNRMTIAWISLPTLQAITWEALCYFYRKKYIDIEQINKYIPDFERRLPVIKY